MLYPDKGSLPLMVTFSGETHQPLEPVVVQLTEPETVAAGFVPLCCVWTAVAPVSEAEQDTVEEEELVPVKP